MWINFFNQQDDYAGGVKIFFTSPVQYSLVDCLYQYQGYNFNNTPTSNVNKFWKIALIKTSNARRLVIHCSGLEVLNVLLSDDFCEGSGSDWSTYWSRDVTKIEFTTFDTASDSYKTYSPGQSCSKTLALL